MPFKCHLPTWQVSYPASRKSVGRVISLVRRWIGLPSGIQVNTPLR